MNRCTAMMTPYARCRRQAVEGDELCGTHRKHVALPEGGPFPAPPESFPSRRAWRLSRETTSLTGPPIT